ncbi:hypothetical protein ACJ65_10510 [Kocuria rhizophila]|nr:hypothetical protein ACJ65_10510 [Kocuria rhizophila]
MMAVPMSFCSTSTPIAMSHAASMGAMSLKRGSRTGPTLRPASRIRSRFMDRYPAKKMASVILAISPGWNVRPATEIHSRAPLISTPSPGIMGSRSSTTDSSSMV